MRKDEFLWNFACAARDLRTATDAELRSLGLTLSRGKALAYLARSDDGLSQAALTDLLGVEHPTAVRLIDGLEKAGHVRRVPSPDDRRAKLIRLTESGKPLAETVLRVMGTLNKSVLQGLDEEKLAAAAEVLAAIGENLRRHSASAKQETFNQAIQAELWHM